MAQTDPCAYAYYDLGHALRLAGRPAEAIDALQIRLQNPNQRDVVAAELAAAQQAAGATGGEEAGTAGARARATAGARARRRARTRTAATEARPHRR
ncbi:MAG: hypothetical protein R2736_04970 [Solirubrobacterales bacterium]